MKAIILAGGRGERLSPLTKKIPKPMIKIDKKPLAQYTVELLRKYNCTDAIFTLCYLPNTFRKYFGDGSKFGMHFSYFIENKPLGTSGALSLLKKDLNDTFIVCSGDVLRDTDISAVLEFHKKKGGVATICVYKNEGPNPKSIVSFDKNKKITAFIERPGKVFQSSVWSNASFYVFEPEMLDYIPKDKASDFGKDILPKLLQSKRGVYSYEEKGYILDVGTKEKLKKAEYYIKEKKVMSKKNKKIFITGGAGFIGSHLVDELVRQEKDIIVFDNLSSGRKNFLKEALSKKNVNLIVGDLLNIKELGKALSDDIDMVFHLAANPDISKGILEPTLDFDQTILATFNLLLEMKKKKIKKMVYFSGSGVYGDVGDNFSSENYGPLLPVSMYGASKLSAEALISAFSNLFGIQVWIFRPANIIGDRLTHGVVFDFINKLRKNPDKLIVLGDGTQSKSYLHIQDVLDAVFLALNKTNDRINLFNIASESFITVNEIAKIVIEAMNLKNVKVMHTKGKLGWPGDVPIVRINNGKLRKLGWKEKYSSKEAVKRTLEGLL